MGTSFSGPPLLVLAGTLITRSNHCVYGYPTFMLSGTGCLTDLDPSEVIMNSPVLSAFDTDDTSMHIQVKGHEDRNGDSIFSTDNDSLSLTLASDKTVDHHFIIESMTPEVCHFTEGACDNASRVAGRNHNYVELVLSSKAAKCEVAAGWATGQEAVRLVPTLRINGSDQSEPMVEETLEKQADEKPSDNKEVKEIEYIWFQDLLHDGHCPEVEALHSLKSVGEQAILESHEALHAKYTSDNMFDISFPIKDTDTILIEATSGATFQAKGERMRLGCGARRIALWKEDKKGLDEPFLHLLVEEEHDIYLTGIYRKTGGPSILYRTERLQLEWNAESSSEGNPTQRDEELRDRVSDNKRDNIQEKLSREDGERIRNEKKALGHGSKRFRSHHQKLDTSRLGLQDESMPTLGTEYYMALGFMFFGTFFAIQCCLTVTQTDKGRREL